MKLYYNISKLACVNGHKAKKGRDMSDIGYITDGAFVTDKDKFIFAGKRDKAFELYPDAEKIDLNNKAVIPGFTDSHTHLVFGGYRVSEFMMRLEGRSYMEIMQAGGGIKSTTQATRMLSAEQMAEKTLPFVNELLSYGVTTLEIKSGYGLDKETELRQLQSMKILEEMTPLRIVKTYMGAHALPDEFKNNPSGYIRYICEEVLPAVKEQGIAKYCDVFCEKNVFSKEESAIIFDRAKELGFGLKIHADEIEDGGTTAFGVRYGCTSTDHLLHVSDEGIEALAFGETVATLLPITAFSLKEKYAPARRLIDKGAAVAIATDCNPGSCFSDSIPLLIALSSLNMGMTFEEILCSLTLNGAAAVGNAESFGSIQEGKYADFLVLKWEDPAFLNYHICGNGVEKVYIGGKMVRENSF